LPAPSYMLPEWVMMVGIALFLAFFTRRTATP
jgi:hypothetical protein